MARKKKKIKEISNEEMIEKLAEKGLSKREIAEFLEINETTFDRNYGSFYTKGRKTLKMKLREKQIDIAMNGNPAMLIWLGKVYLGQKDSDIQDESFEIIVKRSVISG
ncbi:MAG: hypothetical protein FJW56_04635 [Actinobacteria bacterium]|nr:hypothetical protein [Actinomycetota bacterium]